MEPVQKEQRRSAERQGGLTVDHLVWVELVLPSGDVVRLSGDSTGADAELWWAVRGCAPSFGVVTSAAVIMVAVFSIFATLSEIEFKVFGVAMAVAVLIDATVVRGILVPAAMTLLGERSWYLPGWLAWLPGRQLDRPG